MDKKRIYYFDGKNILDDKTNKTLNSNYNNTFNNANSNNFDQIFEEINASEIFHKSSNYKKEISQSTFNKNFDHTYGINFQNFMLSGENQNNQGIHIENQENTQDKYINEDLEQEYMHQVYQDQQNREKNTNIISNNEQIYDSNMKSSNEAKSIPEDLINNLKDNYFKKRGYIENKPEVLFEFLLEYRGFYKRGLKVPTKIAPLLAYNDQDLFYSLNFYYNAYLSSYNKTYNSMNKRTMSIKGVTMERFKSKFSNDTLKRLYPFLKEEDQLMKTKSDKNGPVTIERMIDWLLNLYHGKFKEYTNDYNKLFEFWNGFSNEEKELKGIKWPLDDKNFESHLTQFFSNDKIVKRLAKNFESICGYECFHPRPLHDYWTRQLTVEERFKKGLNKYDSEDLFKILVEYYNKLREETKNEETLKNQNSKEEELKNTKTIYKDKKRYEALVRRFSDLAKPKDKWRTGREMINLRRQFRYDNIIKKMIKLEFQSNRVFKYPEEYAIYDENEMRQVIFKNSLEKKIKRIENEDYVKELLSRTKCEDDKIKQREETQLQLIYKEDLNLEKYLRNMCIKYYKLSKNRLVNTNVYSDSQKAFTINKFMTDMYNYMLKYHSNSTRRRFPKLKINYGRRKTRFSNYPKEMKYYFFTLYRRLGVSEDGERFIFAHIDNMPFWAPAISNKCKVHKDNCPIYCRYNTHNKIIYTQKSKSYDVMNNTHDKKLNDVERLNLWKRKDEDLMKKKSKIFMCLSEVEHCTFEPKLNKNEENNNYNNKNSNEDFINKRISNKVWVNQMGENFSGRFPLVYKEGIYKQAKVTFQSGKFSETLSILSTAFNLDMIKAKFDPKYAVIYKKKLAMEKEKDGNKNEINDSNNMNILNMMSRDEKKKEVEPDNFDNPKNYHICLDIFNMLKVIEEYKEDRKKSIKRLKEEINLIKETKKETNLNVTHLDSNNKINLSKEKISNSNTNNNNNTVSQNLAASTNMNTINNKQIHVKYPDQIHKINFIKDKYFKFFKTIMCPLKEECPYDIRPRWPHSGIKTNVPFGFGCPYAHHISEIKFEQEIKQKIKLRENLVKELEKDKDPEISQDWIPTGPIISCNGCGKTFSEKTEKGLGKRIGAGGGPKGLCGFCRYHQKNELEIKKDKKEADKANEQILKKINYGGIKAEEWDQDYLKKFGMLKKAAVLYSFRKYTDSIEIMKNLMEIVKVEKNGNEEKFNNLDKKWRAKLQISETIPKDILSYEITQEVIDYFNIKTPFATLLIYVDKMRKGNSFSIYNRHTYLNNQIDEFNLVLKKTFNRLYGDIKTMKNKISELNLWSTKKKKLEKENPELYDRYYKKYRAEMCPNVLKKQKCVDSFRDCKFAHNPSQLNLRLAENQKGLLKNSIKETLKKTQNSKSIVAWKYPKQKIYEKGLKFDKKLVANNCSTQRKLRSKSAGRYKSVDIKKLRINYHEI